ncbi:carboxypeptidase regulatory-like domain-containing protein [Streptomyces sp. NPDC058864]
MFPSRPPRRRRRPSLGAGLLSVAFLAAFGAAPAPAQAAEGGRSTAPASAPAAPGHVEPLCGTPEPHEFACFGLRRTDLPAHKGLRAAGEDPEGFGPADLRSAYGLPADGGAGRTIAVVDAFDNPDAEADLAVYRAQYGLPACTTANGCFTKADQRGGTHYPDPDPGWAGEISLDLDMVSAVAPNARILLVEADSAGVDDLGAAVDQAVALGAGYVSNSYGSNYAFLPEDPGESAADVHYDHPGVAVVASSGDSRYGVAYPAASPHVTAVGGTTLTRDAGTARGWSESVWDHDGAGTGSGCSRYEPKPAFQEDTGCPGRTVADVSAVADPATGVAVYDGYNGGGWGVAGGTSASAPIIAGVYAAADAPVAGTYPNTYPYAQGGPGLHDVTAGANGRCSPAYLCTAGAGYDGPTGLGTPNGTGAFRMGPHGTVTGTVTDRRSGSPLPGAVVTAGIFRATTDARGRYTLPLPAGRHDVRVEAYGYAPGEAADVDVTDGAAVPRDVTLRKLATHRVSGTVSDGSGHGWPLHAKITVDGVPGAPVWSDAYTGAYRLDLPENHTYTLRVVGDDSHYRSLVRQVTVGTADRELRLALPADTWATADPAYRLTVRTVDTQPFDSAAGAPEGWSVADAPGTARGWAFDDPGARGNTTGGSGAFAVADNDHAGWDTALDTQLISPVYDFTGKGDPALAFATDYEGSAEQRGDVDVSDDGGRTWTTVWHQDQLWSSGRVEVPLTAYAGERAVRLRFHFTGPGMLWAVDDVTVTRRILTPVPGGVVTGTVTDANTGRGLVAAVVRTGAHASAQTTATTGDPRTGDGLYRLFVPGGGSRAVTTAKPAYRTASRSVTVRPDRVVKASFALAAGRLSLGTARIDVTTASGGKAVRKVTVRNTGTAPATLRIGERTGTGPGSAPPAGAWRTLPDLPVPVMDNAVETDRGRLYSALGSDGPTPTADLYVYDPAVGTWTRGAPAPEPRQATAHGIIGGRLYTVGGWGPQETVSSTLQVYDTVRNTWAKGPAVPEGHYGAAGAVLDGRLYVVGGCTNTDCAGTVYVFDPASGRWTRAADYPQSIGWTSCGAISGRLYCAGGTHEYVETSAAYVYDPASDGWQPVADMPVGLATSAYTSANGRLLVSGGFKRVGVNRVLTPEGYAYDPGSDTWTPLPRTATAVYRGGGAPGMYRVGGSDQSRFPVPVATVEELPGWDGTETDVGWLTESPVRLTLRPGERATFTVRADAHGFRGPQDRTASLVMRSDTPYWLPPVPVALHVTRGRAS